MQYAVINDQDTIVNVIVLLAEMTDEWTPPVGHTAEPLVEGTNTGDVRIDGVWTTPVVYGTIESVQAERTRRLELGFDYTFPDDRGTHHFATTEEDMKGWNIVDTSSTAFISVGLPDQAITLVTDSGVVAVTAIEWKSIMVAATVWQQPIWQASFALQEMDPIPADFKDDSYWT